METLFAERRCAAIIPEDTGPACCREPEENAFPYMICAVKQAGRGTSGYKTAQIPAAVWAVFREDELEGYGQRIPQLFNRAYSEWLPTSGYDKADGPDVELYGAAAVDGKLFEEV